MNSSTNPYKTLNTVFRQFRPRLRECGMTVRDIAYGGGYAC